MTVGFFSPLPPARTGVAEYSATLLTALRRHGPVEVAPPRASVNLYHIGNNQLHGDIYRRALGEPGVVVLHDAVLHHFALGFFSRDEYVEEFAYNYGDWSRGLARQLWESRARSGIDERYFRYGLLRRIAESARAVVVHNAAAASAVRRHARSAHIVEIPHLFAPPPAAPPANLGVRAGTAVLGLFGHLRESKRVLPVLRVFRRLPGNLLLLLAGDFVSRDLARAVEPLLRQDGRIRRFPFTPEAEFWSLAQATDICLNLRYPSVGESSGIGVRFMGIGRAVVATDGPEMAGIPHSAFVPVDSGVREEPALESAIRWLIAYPDDARDIGANASRYICEYHSLERVGELYWQTLLAAT